MKIIDLEKIFLNYKTGNLNRLPNVIRKLILISLAYLLKIKEINKVIVFCGHKSGIEFIDEVLELFDISYRVSAKDKLKIPSEGKLLIVSNHPLGGVDGIILLKLLSEVRNDIKIVVNDVLNYIENLKEFFLPVDLYSGKISRENIERIFTSLNNDEAVIIFPAGEVSRLRLNGIKDSDWKKSVIQIVSKVKAPVLPIFIHGRNSILFYLSAIVSKKLSMFLLPREIFNKKGANFDISIGHQIPATAFDNKFKKSDQMINLLFKHTTRISKGKSEIFNIEKNVIHPISKKNLKQQLYNSTMLGFTSDRKNIFLVESYSAPDVIKEIARLREITFRKVSEGTGKKMDLDKYDDYYKHIVLWDDKDLEIVGAYRIGIGRTIMSTLGVKGFYTSEIFDHSIKLESKLQHSAELGRSFIQSKYWNTSALDYLWQGLGRFLKSNPDIKYTFGGVSLSKSYSDEAKNHIIYFFSKWFSHQIELSAAKNKYVITPLIQRELQSVYSSQSYKEELNTLKKILKHLGYTIPTLYKQYSELCEQDGIHFLDFGVDSDFNDCVDALIIVEIDKIKQTKKDRYLSNTINTSVLATA